MICQAYGNETINCMRCFEWHLPLRAAKYNWKMYRVMSTTPPKMLTKLKKLCKKIIKESFRILLTSSMCHMEQHM